MYKISSSLQRIIDSGSPPSVDIQNNIPPIFKDFITELEQLSIPADRELKEFDCAIASKWKQLWPWMECALKTNHIFEAESHLSPQAVIDRAFTYSIPVLSVLTRILSFSSARTTQSSLICRIMDSSNFKELLSLAWVVAIIQPHTRYVAVVTQMLETTRLEHSIDKGRMDDFMGRFEAYCLILTGKFFFKLWKQQVTAMVEDDTSVHGQQVYLILQLLRVPGNTAVLDLIKAGVAMKYLDLLWRLLLDRESIVVGSELCSSPEIRIRCINSLLSCYLIWVSGGARWIVVALDHNLIARVAETCRFLDRVRDGVGCEIATRAALNTILQLLQGVHIYKAYHSVSRRVKSNLDWCMEGYGRESSVAPLRLRTGNVDDPLRRAWHTLAQDFRVAEAIVMRKALSTSSKLFLCASEQCPNAVSSVLSLDNQPDRHICSRCLATVYCGVECQHADYARHRVGCKAMAKTLNKHPLYTQGHKISVSDTDTAYMQNMLCVAMQRARDHTRLSDKICRAKRATSAPLAVVFDLSLSSFDAYEIKPQEVVLSEMLDQNKRMELAETKPDIVFCGRVPLFGNFSTLIVFTDRQVLFRGDCFHTEKIIRALVTWWSNRYWRKKT